MSENKISIKNFDSLVYGARDVANAPNVKKTIKSRSQNRNDSNEITRWLTKNFYCYIIGDLQSDAIEKVTDIEHVKKLQGSEDVPNWLTNKLDTLKDISSSNVWWVHTTHESILALEQKIIEFLNSRIGTPLEGKLMRVNCLQALAIWQAEHEKFLEQQEKGLQTHNPDALTYILKHDLGCFYEFNYKSKYLRAEMAYESQHMQHCVGQFADKQNLIGGYGEHYATDCQEGKLRLFTLRNHKQQPHITLSINVSKYSDEDDILYIDQIKGKQNSVPIKKYHQAILDFLNQLENFDDDSSGDLSNMDMINFNNKWRFLYDITDEMEQLEFLKSQQNYYTSKLNITSPLVQWLALVHEPYVLNNQNIHPTLLPIFEKE